jgi:DNA polymerase-3 subunit delta'
MQAPKQKGHILIATNLEMEVERIVEELQPSRSVVFFEENFKIEHAKAVLSEAYISSSETKYIVLAASEFTTVAQNSLLKLLEEPPPHIEFIIISPTKSNLLATVRSRLPILKVNTSHNKQEVSLNFSRIDYAEVFAFLKENARVKKSEAKELVETMYNRATQVDKLILTATQLDNFDKAYRLLDLNSRPQSVLAMLIMSFVREK